MVSSSALISWLTRPRLVLAAAALSMLALGAQAAPPAAGSIIGNQASATYTDSSGQTKSATSNLVETTVRQVGGFSLTQDNSKIAAVGNTVYMPHTLRNSGNGSDSFVLSTSDIVAATDTDFATNVNIYADANGDGVPDSTTPLCSGLGCSVTTPSLPSNGSFTFVVSMSVPGTATSGQNDQIIVRAAGSTLSIYDGNNNGVFGEANDNVRTNLDSLTVTGAAAFQLSKSISTSQGPTGVLLTYTLTYKNIGAAAGNFAFNDVIGSGATVGMSYSAGSAVWSAGSTSLTDSYVVGTPDATVGSSAMHYRASTVGAVTTIDGTVTNVAANVTGTVTFRVNVLSSALVGTSTTTNTALYGVDTDANPTNNTLVDGSNQSSYNVLPSFSVVANDGTAGAVDGANSRPSTGDTDAPANADLSYVATGSPGQSITFNTTVWNTGNGVDSFNISAAGMAGGGGYGTWPSGTIFQLFKSDGATPLTDSGSDGVADTGPIAAGASYLVVVKASIPPAACTAGCPAGPFDIQMTATSVGDPTKSNVTFARLGAMVAPTVDLANSTGAVNPAVNQDVIGAAPIVTRSTAPGGSAVFDLFVRNEGNVSDSYSLEFSGTNSFVPASALPAGWTMQFRTAVAGVCSDSGGSVITSVGPVAPGVESKFCAVINTPANAAGGNTEVYFQAKSLASGATDALWDRVAVTPVNALILQPSHTGQIYPGGTVVYPYTLVSGGNTSCGPAFTFSLTESLAAQGWSSILYRDVNGNGAIDAGDTVIDPAVGVSGVTLTSSSALNLLIKVFAPAGAAVGSNDLVSLSASGSCGAVPTTSNTATGSTTVVSGQVRLIKTQAIDHNCDGTPSLPTPDPASRSVGASFSSTVMQAFPGECILYRVTATNEGLGNVLSMNVADTLPAYTLFGAGPTCSLGTAAYAASSFSCSGITLAPSVSATMDFRVQVQP